MKYPISHETSQYVDRLNLLRRAIRIGRHEGILVPSSERVNERFIAVADSELCALVRHATHVMREEGLSAAATVDLDGAPPYLAVHVADCELTAWLWPLDVNTVTLLMERKDHPAISQSFSYDDVIGGRLLRPFQESLIRALDGPKRSQPPV